MNARPTLSPSSLFLDLWNEACTWKPSMLTSVIKPDRTFFNRAISALELDGAEDAYQHLVELKNEEGFPAKGRALIIMQAIDEVFYRIHPRARNLPASAGLIKIPNWLKDAREHRLINGSYLSESGRSLVPRGPLSRLPRDEVASNGESLADRFAALAVVSGTLYKDEFPVKVKLFVRGNDISRGVPPGKGHSETVAFLPVAESFSDLKISLRDAGGRTVAKYESTDELAAKNRIVKGISRIGSVDIAIASELLVSESQADALEEALISASSTPRMIVCGSGNTNSIEDGQAWNESRVLNGVGSELWRQRKIWPAGLTRERAVQYGFSDPGEANMIVEDNCSGEEIIVADIDTLGRCVVLICQDIETRPLSDDLIRTYQPDWVFSPILDQGIDVGRWGHQRAFSLSAISNAKYLLCSSTALADHCGKTDVACGLAVGPRGAVGDEEGRMYSLAYAVSESDTAYAVLHWGGKGWSKTSID